jgi:hypothetical protein
MNLNTLKMFRQHVYDCMESRADALFNLCDGLLSERQARSLPELSHSPFFERQWPSIYAALADGKINIEKLQALCVRSVLADLPEDAPIWIAIDGTPIERPEAKTSEDRGYIHVSNLPLADKPISIGWMVSVVGLLPEQASSWTPPLDFQRIGSEQTAVGVAIEQLRRLKPLFGNRQVVVVADRWYGTPEMLRACQSLGYRVLIRLKSNRKLYRKPVRRFPRGRLPVDGPLLQGTREAAQFDPAEMWESTDQEGRVTRVSRWDGVHFQQDRDLSLSVIRVERNWVRGTKRDPRVSWFLTLDRLLPLEEVPQRYGLRFSEEHLFRFLKQDLLWLAAHLRTPEQFLRWSWIVALAFLQLYLARPLGLATLLPWEAKGRPVTPRQVRRVMPTLLSQLGTPVRACQPRGKAPGRAKGFRPRLAPRYPVIHKTSKKEKKAKQPSRLEGNLLAFFIKLVFLWAKLVPSWLCSGYFCLNINTVESRFIDDLVREWETTSVEFKQYFYVKSVEQKAEFIKDVLGLANTQASGRRWLIISFNNKTREYFGPPEAHLRQDDLECLIAEYTDPCLELRYEVVDYRKGPVGKLEILRDPKKVPYRVAKSLGDKLKGNKKQILQGQIFVRHGSQVEEPTDLELQALLEEGNRARSMHSEK